MSIIGYNFDLHRVVTRQSVNSIGERIGLGAKYLLCVR